MSSGVFKWSSDSRYFNPMCDEQLYFDTYNSGTEPKFCVQETCLAPVFTPTGVEVPCDQVLKPSGYTNRIFKWGIKNASWTLDANYDGFVRDDYAFVQPFQITESEDAVDNCMVKGMLAWDNGYRIKYFVNGNAFNRRFKTVYVTPDGFTPMEGRELDGMTIDPSVVGAKILKPASYGNPYLCADSNTYIEPPEIEYFTVGTDQVPSSNTVVLKDAPISTNYTVIEYGTPAANTAMIAWGVFSEYGVPGHQGQSGVICYEGSNSVTVNTGAYPTDRNNLTTYRQNPYNYNPSLGAISNNTVQFSWVRPTGLSGGTPVTNLQGVITTGYRIQKYVQKMHRVYFSDGKPQVQTGVRHLETKVKTFGYKITWEFVSATISKYVSTIVPNTYTPDGHVTISHSAKGDVTLRITYEPYVSTFEEYGPYVTATNRCSPITTTSTQYRGYLYNPPANQYNICLSANQYGELPIYRSDGAVHYGLLTTRGDFLYSPTYGQYTQNYWDFYESALGSGMSSFSTSNPLNPKSQSSVANYEFPLNRQVSNFNLVTVVNGVNVNPQPPQSNQPTRDGKLWRTLSGAINPVSNSTIDISFSNRAEWFNPTCPFELIYDQYESNEDWHPNGCRSTITPIILSTG